MADATDAEKLKNPLKKKKEDRSTVASAGGYEPVHAWTHAISRAKKLKILFRMEQILTSNSILGQPR